MKEPSGLTSLEAIPTTSESEEKSPWYAVSTTLSPGVMPDMVPKMNLVAVLPE